MKRRFAILLALVLALTAFATPGAFANKNEERPTANLVETAIAANGGLPSETGGAGDFDILISALQLADASNPPDDADLLDTLMNGSFAVYAPTDKAFIELAGGVPEGEVLTTLMPVLTATYGDPVVGLVDVLTYHVAAWDGGRLLRGSTEMVNGDDTRIYRRWMKDATGNWVRISAGPIYASNGYISVIDEVLLPEAFNPTLLDVALEANAGGDFDILIGALSSASNDGEIDFLGALGNRDASFAVYAPTDGAFVALAQSIDSAATEESAFGIIAGVLEAVYDDGNPETNDAVTGLTDVLAYHVADTDRRPFGKTEMLNGDDTRIYWRWIRDETRQWTRIVDGPIYAANGYLYVVNNVLLPSAFK